MDVVCNIILYALADTASTSQTSSLSLSIPSPNNNNNPPNTSNSNNNNNNRMITSPARGSSDLKIYHAGTSHLNPVKWYEAARWVSAYWRQHNVQRRVDQTPLRFKFYKNDLVYKTHFYLRNELPATIYAFFAK